jgi:hypothetical protein
MDDLPISYGLSVTSPISFYPFPMEIKNNEERTKPQAEKQKKGNGEFIQVRGYRKGKSGGSIFTFPK